eukprot:scaffold38857_cov63-Phaeocystis_antarctica.AAC.2
MLARPTPRAGRVPCARAAGSSWRDHPFGSAARPDGTCRAAPSAVPWRWTAAPCRPRCSAYCGPGWRGARCSRRCACAAQIAACH